jgi:hypothetical protein
MGCFSYTCGISGLPIEAGDPVRFLLLTQCPFGKPAEHTCGINNRWAPRTFPLRAKYNEYGSIEKVEEGLSRDIWLEGFQVDLITRGTGDNSVHDVAVRKDMTFEDLLRALWEGRVLVRDQGGRVLPSPLLKLPEGIEKVAPELVAELMKINLRNHPLKDKTPKGVPTMKRVQRTIVGAGQAVSDAGFQGGFLVDRKSRGFIRVRAGSCEGELERLKVLRKLLRRKWATFLTVGTGAYAHTTELILGPKPKRYGTSFGVKKKVRNLPVAQAMIREDVWLAICGGTFHSWRGRDFGVQDYREAARDLYRSYHGEGPGILSDPPHEGHPVFHLAHSELTGPGLGYHFHQMMEHHPEGEELERFLDVVGETIFVQNYLASIRFQWQPGHSSGPQFGEWSAHKEYLGALFSIAVKKFVAQEAERRSFDE